MFSSSDSFFSRKDLQIQGSGLQQIGEWKVFGKPGCSHRGFSFHYFLRDLWLCKTFPRHDHDLSLAFPMHFLAIGLAWHCLGMSMHLIGFLGMSWIVQACQFLGLFRLVMSATQGIHIALHFVHVHTCARFGVKLGHGCQAWPCQFLAFCMCVE